MMVCSWFIETFGALSAAPRLDAASAYGRAIDIKTGRIGPEHARYRAGIEHLNGCWRCRAEAPVDERKAA